MSAGTIALTNNSTAVTGTGTSFTADLKVGDFITATVGGIVQTLGVASIASNTSLTLSQAFVGPTTSGLAWVAIPNGTLVGITSQIAAQVWQAIRAYNQEKVNWQNFYTGTGTITITLFDGTVVSGLAWPSINNAVNGKATKGANSDITSLTGLTTALSIAQGGTGGKTAVDARTGLGLKGAAVLDVGTTAGTVAAGNDLRIAGALQTSGGTLTGGLVSTYKSGPSFYANSSAATNSGNNTFNYALQANINATQYMQMDVWNDSANVYARIVTWNTNAKVFRFVDNGNGVCDGQWINGSDIRYKYNIKTIENPLTAVLGWRGATYDKIDGASDVGLIAQDVEKDCPTAVINTGKREYSDGTVIEDFKSLNTIGVAAAFHTESIKMLFSLVELALTDPETALKHIDEIKKAVIPPVNIDAD